jgi:predicted hydrolase (HD superfamily)
MYAQLLEQMYEHAHLLGDDSDAPGMPPAVQSLIGGTYSATPTGRVYQTGEAIRGLVQLEMQERKLCADFASKAVAAGLAERQVRMAERQGQAVIEAITVALDAAGLSGEARMLAQNAAADKLLELTA